MHCGRYHHRTFPKQSGQEPNHEKTDATAVIADFSKEPFDLGAKRSFEIFGSLRET
jgi:hypothetical protein